MKHLSSDDILTALESGAVPDAHLAACDACRARVDELRQALARARDVPVPEPSPLFWAHFSERVREAVADSAPTHPVARWRRALLIPTGTIGALALVVMVLVVVGPQAPTPAPPAAVTVENSASGALVDTDDSWGLVSDVAGELDWETAGEAGLAIRPGLAERALGELSELEREKVAELLQQELADRGSNVL